MIGSTASVQALDLVLAPTDRLGFIRRLLQRRLAAVCVAYLVAIVGVAIVAPIALPHVADQHVGELLANNQGPSWTHPLGTDTLGRDVLQRLLVGTRLTLIGSLEALVVVLVLGVPFGLAAGFFGGWIDRVVTWVSDIAFSLPGIVIIIVVVSVFPLNMTAGMITLGALAAPGLMRVVRGATLPVREELYISALQVAGLPRHYVLRRHVLPRIAGVVIVQASLFSGAAVLVQSGLAALGLIVAAPAPSWGGMLADGLAVIELQPWLIFPPGAVIGLTVLALGLLGDSIRDVTAERWAAPTRSGRPRRVVSVSSSSTAAPREPGGDSPLLSIEDLSVSFSGARGDVKIVEGVEFDVRPGETVGIVGETGCGKTVTALSILGLLPGTARIDSGKIMFDGRDLVDLTEKELRALRGKKIGFVSQEPMTGLNPVFRVGWQIAESVRTHHNVSRSEARLRTLGLLRQVRLPEPELVARRYPHELSGGMAQRVALARALSGEPSLLIADEPTTALDATVQAEILDLLRAIQQERAMAVLLVTHDWGVVADICDRCVVMYAGQAVERADSRAVFAEPWHPYTEALLAASPYRSVGVEMLPTIPGAVPKPGAWPSGCHFHPRCAYATDECRVGAIPLDVRRPPRATRCIHAERLISS